MIARIWRGVVRTSDADTYGEYIRETGLSDYAATDGNRGAWLLRRALGGRTEFVTVTLWESLDAVKGFAGEDFEAAVYYPEDERFLIERDERCAHYEVEEGSRRVPSGFGTRASQAPVLPDGQGSRGDRER